MRHQKRRLALHLVVPVLSGLFAMACGGRSRLLQLTVNAPSLQENTVGLSIRQPVLVYLPPSYGQAGQGRYPVLYFLPGYDDPAWIFTSGDLQGFRLRDAMDRLIAKGLVGEMIVVLPSGATPLGGTFYWNSPVLGRWEDYISRELVEYVDSRFRTLQCPSGRAIAGTTAGGSGALILAMRHPGIFGTTYALDPVLLRPGTLDASALCRPEAVGRLLGLQEAWAALPEREGSLARTLYLQARLGSSAEADHLQAFFIAMGAAFSPDPGKRGLPIRFPYRRTAGGLVPDHAGRAAFESGLGGWEERIDRYGPNLRRLRLIALDYGTGTGMRWLPEGCIYVSDLLASAGIPHRTLPHGGNHENRFRERMEGFLLPMVSEALHAEKRDLPSARTTGWF
jgi:Putative esterase